LPLVRSRLRAQRTSFYTVRIPESIGTASGGIVVRGIVPLTEPIREIPRIRMIRIPFD